VGGGGLRWARWWFKKVKEESTVYGCIKPTWLKLKEIYCVGVYSNRAVHPFTATSRQARTAFTSLHP